MNNDSNFHVFAKLVAISIVGGVAKTLFSNTNRPSPILTSVGESVKTATEAASRRATS
jgi:hypothetical protein